MNRLRAKLTQAEIEDFESQFAGFQFFHRFEIFDGVFTPGQLLTDPVEILDRNGIEADLSGLNAADVGCMEGSMAFELESRGATAWAVDVHDPDSIAFNLCRNAVDSTATYIHDSVYNLPRHFGEPTLDLAVFRGVYYHLKHPLAALEALSAVVRPGGRMILSGECLVNEMFDLDGKRFDAGPISQTELDSVPLTACYPGTIKGVPSSIWFVPNVACIRSWLQATGFDLQDFRVSPYSENTIAVSGAERALQRFEGLAVRNDTAPVIEHPIWEWRRD